MLDLHCHIFPGIDDRAKSMDDSLAMAYAAVAEGITHISATLHYKIGRWDNENSGIQKGTESLQCELNNRNIPLIIFPKQEV